MNSKNKQGTVKELNDFVGGIRRDLADCYSPRFIYDFTWGSLESSPHRPALQVELLNGVISRNLT
jgi:hypothetical protein